MSANIVNTSCAICSIEIRHCDEYNLKIKNADSTNMIWISCCTPCFMETTEYRYKLTLARYNNYCTQKGFIHKSVWFKHINTAKAFNEDLTQAYRYIIQKFVNKHL